jgi:hypothetical protein
MLLCVTLLGLMGCKQDSAASLTGKEIISYEIAGITGVLSGDAHTIVVAGLAKGFDLSKVEAKIKVSEGASIYPPETDIVNLDGQSMTYEVTAEDGGKQEYVVSATRQPYSIVDRLSGTGSIQVRKLPTQTVYEVNDTFDPTGLEVVALWNDGAPVSVVEDYTLTQPNLTSSGTKEVTVAYGGRDVKFNIIVNGFDHLVVQTPPTKTVYRLNKDTIFEPAGLVVQAVSTDNVITTLDSAEYTLIPPDLTTAAVKTVTVTYGGKDETFNITVAGLGSLKVKTLPTKTVYELNDTFNPAGLDVQAIYVDATNADVELANATLDSAEYTLTFPADFLTTTGSGKTVTVGYGGKTVDFNITVHGLDRLFVQTLPTKAVYKLDETFNPNGLVVQAITTDEIVTTLSSSNYTLSLPDLTSVGTKAVTVSYGGKTVDFDITVEGAKFTRIAATGLETIYRLDATQTLTERELFGLTVTKYYDDDSNEVVPFADYTITYDANITGTQAIKVEVTEDTVTQSTSFNGTVAFLKKLAQTEDASEPKKLYSLNDTSLDINGLALTGTFSNGGTQTIAKENVSLVSTFPASPKAYLAYPITVRAGSQTYTFEIGFYDPEAGISVAIAGDKKIEIYNVSYGKQPPEGGLAFTLAWRQKKANDQYATPDMSGTSYDDRLDKLIVSVSSSYVYNVVWSVDGTQVSSNNNVLVIDAEDYTIGNHFLTVSVDSGRLTETIKFNVIR